MKISKLNYIALVLLLWSTSPSFSQADPDPWVAPPPAFEEETNDVDVPNLPINTALYVLSMSGILLAGGFILKRRTRKKTIK
jgi:hypothetical protein